jgi:hypothetical protein
MALRHSPWLCVTDKVDTELGVAVVAAVPAPVVASVADVLSGPAEQPAANALSANRIEHERRAKTNEAPLSVEEMAVVDGPCVE